MVPRNEALDLVEDARDALPERSEQTRFLQSRAVARRCEQRKAQQVLSGANAQASDLIPALSVVLTGSSTTPAQIPTDTRTGPRAEARRMIDEQEVLLRVLGRSGRMLEDAQLRARDRSWTLHSASR